MVCWLGPAPEPRVAAVDPIETVPLVPVEPPPSSASPPELRVAMVAVLGWAAEPVGLVEW
jgi:hypothetical protein